MVVSTTWSSHRAGPPKIVVAGTLATAAVAGLLALLGLVLVVVGIRPRDRQKRVGASEDEYHAKSGAGQRPVNDLREAGR